MRRRASGPPPQRHHLPACVTRRALSYRLALLRGDARGELGAVAYAELRKGVRNVPLDGLPREKQALRNLGVARPGRDERRNLAFASGQRRQAAVGDCLRTAPPCPHAKRAKLVLSQLDKRRGAEIGRRGGRRAECPDGSLTVQLAQRSAQIEPRPDDLERKSSLSRLDRGSFELCGGAYRLAGPPLEERLYNPPAEALPRVLGHVVEVPVEQGGLGLVYSPDSRERFCLSGERVSRLVAEAIRGRQRRGVPQAGEHLVGVRLAADARKPV